MINAYNTDKAATTATPFVGVKLFFFTEHEGGHSYLLP